LVVERSSRRRARASVGGGGGGGVGVGGAWSEASTHGTHAGGCGGARGRSERLGELLADQAGWALAWACVRARVRWFRRVRRKREVLARERYWLRRRGRVFFKARKRRLLLRLKQVNVFA
jgi:hypothetical protein